MNCLWLTFFADELSCGEIPVVNCSVVNCPWLTLILSVVNFHVVKYPVVNCSVVNCPVVNCPWLTFVADEFSCGEISSGEQFGGELFALLVWSEIIMCRLMNPTHFPSPLKTAQTLKLYCVSATASLLCSSPK